MSVSPAGSTIVNLHISRVSGGGMTEQGVSLVAQPVVDAVTMAAADIAALDDASDRAFDALRPETTKTAYRGDYAKWLAFASESGIPTDAATRGALRAFVHWTWEQGATPASVDRRLTGAVVTLPADHRARLKSRCP